MWAQEEEGRTLQSQILMPFDFVVEIGESRNSEGGLRSMGHLTPATSPRRGEKHEKKHVFARLNLHQKFNFDRVLKIIVPLWD